MKIGNRGFIQRQMIKGLFVAFLVFGAAVGGARIFAQAVSTYTFTPGTTTFTPLVGATTLTTISGDADDGAYPLTSIGFTFRYDGTNYTQVAPGTNGFMVFGAAANLQRNNSLDGSTIVPRPFVAPFYDDLDMGTGSVSYLTTGTAPNRIFTVQWLNAKWDYLAAAPGISFQVKLYETLNRVQFIYRQEAGAIGMDPSSFGATIGLAGTATGVGNYLSLNNSGATPTASSTVHTTNISTKPSTGRTYFWIPTPSAAGVNVAGRILNADGAGIRNTKVTLTRSNGAVMNTISSSFGYYSFEDLPAGETVTVSVASKRYNFANPTRVVVLTDNISDFDFVSEP